MTLNDAILAATGGPTINDGLSTFFGKTVDETLNDAAYRWLTEQGIPPTQINDMWLDLLRGLGAAGALNDMLLDFWLNGGLVPINLYVNPEYAGGFPPTAHSNPFANTDGAIVGEVYQSNTNEISGRNVLAYSLAANNPLLNVGGTYLYSVQCRKLNTGNYGAAINQTAVANLTIIESVRGVNNTDGWKTLFIRFTVDALGYTGDIRFGCGTTANNTAHLEYRNPRLVELVSPIVVTPQILTVAQFPNINKRGYRDPSIGSLVPPTNPLFSIEELLTNGGNGKLVLRGTGNFTKMVIDGVEYLKANATFDGFDTWRWSIPAQWNVGDIHVVVMEV